MVPRFSAMSSAEMHSTHEVDKTTHSDDETITTVLIALRHSGWVHLPIRKKDNTKVNTFS